jgi:predicted secreted protein
MRQGFKTIVFFFLSLCALLAVSVWLVRGAHALGSRIEGGDSMVMLQKTDSGRQIEVKPGATVRIELSGSGGTGYWWYVTRIDTKHAELVSEETKQLGERKPGGPVQGIWLIKAKESGRTEVVLKYYRVWEGPDKAEDQFSIILNIK